jgi:hypothetical protein
MICDCAVQNFSIYKSKSILLLAHQRLLMSQESEQKSIVSLAEQGLLTQSIDTKFLDRKSPSPESRDDKSAAAETTFYLDDMEVGEGQSQHSESNTGNQGPLLSKAEKLAREIVQKKLNTDLAHRFVWSICKSREWLNDTPIGEIDYSAGKQGDESLIVEQSTPVRRTRTRVNGHAGWEYHYALFGNEPTSKLGRGGRVPASSRGSENSQVREPKYHPSHPLGSPFQERTHPSASSSLASTGLATRNSPSHPPRSNSPYPTASGLIRVPAKSLAISAVANNPSAAGPLRRSKSTGEPKKGKHICSVCGKPFLRPSGLVVHNRTHTGEKPFLCPEPSCERSTTAKAFAVKSNWSRHVRVCHPELVGPAIVSSVFII